MLLMTSENYFDVQNELQKGTFLCQTLLFAKSTSDCNIHSAFTFDIVLF